MNDNLIPCPPSLCGSGRTGNIWFALERMELRMGSGEFGKVTEIELVYRNKIKACHRPQIRSSEDAYKILHQNWSHQIGIQEEFNILLLDRRNRVLAISTLSKGGIDSTIVDLRLVFATALKARASSIILAHNHPSGNLIPSKQDIDLTKKFFAAGKLLDLKILDHLILSPDDDYYSFADSSMIP